VGLSMSDTSPQHMTQRRKPIEAMCVLDILDVCRSRKAMVALEGFLYAHLMHWYRARYSSRIFRAFPHLCWKHSRISDRNRSCEDEHKVNSITTKKIVSN
jgi:hypothetical protein